MDTFNEFIVKRKKSLNEILLIVGFIILGFVITFVAVLLIQYVLSFFFAIVIGGWYLVYILIGTQSIEFEYIVTNGEIDVDKIIARKRRKRIITIHSKNFELFAPYNQKYKNLYSNKQDTKIIDASISPESDGIYIATFTHNNKKTALIFNPTQKMIDDFSNYVPRHAFEK